MDPEPPPAKDPAEAPEEEPSEPTKLERFLTSHNCATLGIVMLFSLFLYTVWFMNLCAIEKAKWDPLRDAVQQIKEYMLSLNATYSDFNDTDLILAAEKVSRELLIWAEKIKEIEAEIAELHYKLNHDWTAHKGFLYLFGLDSHSYLDTVKMCNKSKAHLVDILDDSEEEFLAKMIENAHGAYWIGVRNIYGSWLFEVDQTTAPPKYYWKDREPSYHYNYCARLSSGCKDIHKCWITMSCDLQGRGICKQKPEEKWIN